MTSRLNIPNVLLLLIVISLLGRYCPEVVDSQVTCTVSPVVNCYADPSTSSSAAAAAATATPPSPDTVSPPAYTSTSGSQSLFHNDFTLVRAASNTRESCAALCVGAGMPLVGVRGGTECHSGTELNGAERMKLPAGACSLPCPGVSRFGEEEKEGEGRGGEGEGRRYEGRRQRNLKLKANTTSSCGGVGAMDVLRVTCHGKTIPNYQGCTNSIAKSLVGIFY